MTAAPFSFREEQVEPGTRRRFEIPVSRLPYGTHLSITAEVIHGVRPGPTVWLSGALHGDEIVGVEIIHRVTRLLAAKHMAGTVVAVPVVNVFGFLAESRYLPDRRDLNRSFPGSKSGSLAARLAHLFLSEIVAPCDMGIDFHAGSNDRTNLPQLRGDLDDPETRRVALAFGAPLVIHSTPPKGALRAAALKRGKRVLLFEGGEPRRFSTEAVDVGVPGTLRALQALGMLEDAPRPPSGAPAESRKTLWVRAPRGGIFRLRATLGAMVRKGDDVGFISDPTAAGGTTVRARVDGMVLGHTVNPLVHQGDALIHLAVVQPPAPTGGGNPEPRRPRP
jgi:predicted deacylase